MGNELVLIVLIIHKYAIWGHVPYLASQLGSLLAITKPKLGRHVVGRV